jgi:hypothetical protein
MMGLEISPDRPIPMAAIGSLVALPAHDARQHELIKQRPCATYFMPRNN